MKYTKLRAPYYAEFTNVHLVDIHKSEDGGKYYYGTIKCVSNEEVLTNLNAFVQKHKPNGILSNIGGNHQIIKIKFPTHYGRPKYKAIGLNNMPTVAEALQDELSKVCDGKNLIVNLVIKIDGYVHCDGGLHIVLQCEELHALLWR